MTVAIVIPAYNAAGTLPGVIRRIPDLSASVLVIDDGSFDETSRVAEGLGCRVVRFKANRGYGAAMKRGLWETRSSEVVVCLHADGQYAPEEIPSLLQVMEERRLDLLQGSRIASGTALSGGMPLYKYAAGLALTRLEKEVLDLPFTDFHSGYLLYNRRALERIPFQRLSDRFEFDLEMIASARALGLSVGEAAVPTHYGDEVSYLNPITYGLRVLRVMYNYQRGRYGNHGGYGVS